MQRLLGALSHYFETLPERLRRRRWLVLFFFIAATVFMTYGLTKTEFDMTLEGWFADDDPMKVALDEFHAEFGSDDGVFIVYKPADGDLFSARSLEIINEIRNDLLNFERQQETGRESALKHIVRINSLVNAPVLITEENALVSRQLVGKHIPTNQAELNEIRKTALSQRDFPLLYFSKDMKYGGLFIETDFGTIPLDEGTISEDGFAEDDGFGDLMQADDMTMTVDETAVASRTKFKTTDMNDYLDLMEEINAVIYKPEYAQHMEYYLVGNAPLMEYGMEVMAEMKPMTLGMFVIMIVLLWFLFRSFSAVIWPVVIILMSTIWTVGVTGWLGITITTMLMLTVMLILAVGTADAIHILSGYMFFRNKGQSHEKALALSFQKSALACMLTSITTMAGMLALTFTPIVHIQVFGFMSALGVGLAFVFTVYFLPVLLDFWSPVTAKKSSRLNVAKASGKLSLARSRKIPNISLLLQNQLDKVLPLVQRNPVLIITSFLTVFVICIYGTTQVNVDTNIIEQFKEGSSLQKTYQVVDKHMMGTQNMEILFEMGSPNAFQDPAVLNAVDELQQTIERKYSHLVVRSTSLANVVKNAYQALNEDRPEMYIIPQDSRMLSQTLFLFNNANPEDRRKLVSDDYRTSHISIQLHNAGSYEYTNIFSQINSDIDQTVIKLKEMYPDMNVTVTGGLALMMELSDYITVSQIKSLGLAILVISIILIFIFGSVRAGFISIIPNLIPATLTFGLLGLLGIPLDMDTMIIAPVIIGIAVDDTIHFITHYRAEVLIDGDIARALRDTIKEVGQAITFTTLILGLGFSIMAFSSHMGTANLGRYGTLAIFMALACDLFLLPALILLFKPRFLKKGSPKPAHS